MQRNFVSSVKVIAEHAKILCWYNYRLGGDVSKYLVHLSIQFDRMELLIIHLEVTAEECRSPRVGVQRHLQLSDLVC